jgi:hypothetical protein
MDNRETRLRWALRYVMSHPDFSPSVLSEEWKINQEFAIEICAHTLAESVISLGCLQEGKFEELENKIFEKIKSL